MVSIGTRDQIAIITISTIYIILMVLFATKVPDWQTPDEPAHYNYIQQLATGQGIPIIEQGDWDQAYLETLKSTRFTIPSMSNFEAIEYEDHQPPLYYLLMTPVYILTDGRLITIRAMTAVFGLVIVWGAYKIACLMFPKCPWIGLSTAAFVAFQPQHVHILASVNNDALGWAVIAFTLYLIIAYLKSVCIRGVKIVPWHMGVVVGVGFLTKSTTYFMAGVVLLAIVLRHWTQHQQMIDEDREFTFPEETESLSMSYGQLILDWAKFLLPALALGLLWWGRNLVVYGAPDFLGLAAHDIVVIGQPRTHDLVEQLGLGGYIKEMVRVTFNSFWGQFGWMALPLEARFYTMIRAGLVFVLGGLVVDRIVLHPHAGEPITREQRNVWIVIGTVTILSISAFLYYNTVFQQHQGRYMFPLLIPLGLWLALGLDAWRKIALRIINNAIAPKQISSSLTIILSYGIVPVFLLLAIFDVWLLYQVIVPNL